MLNLKRLEISKLIKEYEFVKADYVYKSELVKDADSEFFKNVDQILNINSELKSIYEEKVNTRFDDHNIKFENKTEDDKSIKTDKIKKLYREIAKITHTDKTINNKLNNLYIEASEYYSSNDIIGIYKICEELSINYDIDQSDIDLIKNSIKSYRNGISFIESNHIWIWYNQVENKDQLVLNFIRKQIM